ncbi:response regulator with CheY-like receiver domain and winged-helix DNA-binding domain [Sphaerochaeta pleomorpha str. Grapes]|uniref:Response regulator with CheY-like receiver domain and winged-helix DNA-binding domain n=1 Tax=Sphaerochaeta pleomorpha (strain ATCC BAA-1885 / DSM 22778 / Grapes) TaxID=158190 RepID=G8QRR4_SPHPG|nr:response regulator transcription factor [Sphaerochaeta pleomorpha]AEV28847.1 response regulator with CheY-like receiver domain and winged-helix DNA-binding domain [Sphaerochaeta pleomorpha str. Grapes]
MDASSENVNVIYVVEDHDLIREGVKQYLELSGYKVQGFSTLAAAKEAFARFVPALLIQDVMLPDGDGFSFVKQIKAQYDCPVIFMTARTEESDRIMGFELGADDYISKPFSPKELVLRVQAVIRRFNHTKAKSADDGLLYSGDHIMMFDTKEHRLTVDGVDVIFTAAEWRILGYLVKNSHHLVTRAQILEQCFDYNFDSYERIVDTHIKNIRSKLGEAQWIETVRGYGYRFIGYRKESVVE